MSPALCLSREGLSTPLSPGPHGSGHRLQDTRAPPGQQADKPMRERVPRGPPTPPRMPLPTREHPASSYLLWSPASRRQRESVCPHVITKSLCRHDSDLGPEAPSCGLGKAQHKAASLQLLRLRAGASTLLFKGGDQPRHGAIITPRVHQNQSLWGLAGGRARGGSEDGTTPARMSTLPPWLQKPLPSQRKDGAAAGESGVGGSPEAGSPGGLVSGSRTPDSGRPDRRQMPQRLPDTQVSCPGREPWAAVGSDCGHSPPGPSSACPAVRLPNPTTVGPRPGPGSAGDLPPRAGYSSSHSDKGTRRPDSQGRGHCRTTESSLSGARPPPPWEAGQQGPPSWRRGARKGACCLVPGGERPPTQGAGRRVGRSWGHTTRRSSSPSPPPPARKRGGLATGLPEETRKRGRVHPEPQNRGPHSCARSRRGHTEKACGRAAPG